MPVDVHRCSRHDVAHRFVIKMLPVDEWPAHGVNKLLSLKIMTQAGTAGRQAGMQAESEHHGVWEQSSIAPM